MLSSLILAAALGLPPAPADVAAARESYSRLPIASRVRLTWPRVFIDTTFSGSDRLTAVHPCGTYYDWCLYVGTVGGRPRVFVYDHDRPDVEYPIRCDPPVAVSSPGPPPCQGEEREFTPKDHYYSSDYRFRKGRSPEAERLRVEMLEDFAGIPHSKPGDVVPGAPTPAPPGAAVLPASARVGGPPPCCGKCVCEPKLCTCFWGCGCWRDDACPCGPNCDCGPGGCQCGKPGPLAALFGLVAADPPHQHAPPKGKASPLSIDGNLAVKRDHLAVLTAKGVDESAATDWELDPELADDQALISSDGRTLTFVAPPGVYGVRLTAFWVKDGKTFLQKARATVTVGEPSPPPPPPNDPLFQAVQAAYTADAAADKAKAMVALKMFWQQAATNVLSPTYGGNAGDLFARLTADRVAAFAGLGVNTESLPGVRTAAHAGLSSIFPAQPAAAVTPDQRQQAAALFAKLAALAPQVK